MDASKLSQGQIVAAGGGVLLIVSLFLTWFSGETVQVGSTSISSSANAWDVFSVMDIIMLLIAVAVIAYSVLPATQVTLSLPPFTAWLLCLLSAAVVGLTLTTDLEDGSAGIGAWLGLVASLAMVFGMDEARRASPLAAQVGRAHPAGPSSGPIAPPPSEPSDRTVTRPRPGTGGPTGAPPSSGSSGSPPNGV